MATWKMTEKTMLCGEIDRVVTIIVQGDGQSRCTGYKKFVTTQNKSSKRHIEKLGKKHGQALWCKGPLCDLVMKYRAKLKV